MATASAAAATAEEAVALEAAREALDEPVLASSGLEHGLCVGEGSVVAQRSHERGERVHGCDCRATV